MFTAVGFGRDASRFPSLPKQLGYPPDTDSEPPGDLHARLCTVIAGLRDSFRKSMAYGLMYPCIGSCVYNLQPL